MLKREELKELVEELVLRRADWKDSLKDGDITRTKMYAEVYHEVQDEVDKAINVLYDTIETRDKWKRDAWLYLGVFSVMYVCGVTFTMILLSW